MSIENEYITEANLPLCKFAQSCFYNRPEAKISMGDYYDPDINEQHIYVSVESIDDYAWGAWKPGAVFKDKEACIDLFNRYMSQLPIENGKQCASEENFEEFFKSEGFTEFDY